MRDSPRIKVCGLTRHADARVAEEAGAWYGGVILAPGHLRTVDASTAGAVFAELDLRRVGVFVDPGIDEVLTAVDRIGLHVVQLHGDEAPEFVDAVRRTGCAVIWKAIRVRSSADLVEALARYAGSADGILLDGWSAVARGGAGASFSWDEAAAHRDDIRPDLELVVAGGLRPDNVGRAAALLRPTTVDVSSGVESEPGVKDHRLIRAFVAAVRNSADEVS